VSFSAGSLRAVLDAHVPAGATGLAVALSGGADSASLLCAAALSIEPYRALRLRAIHIDHGLQHAAASFREACAALCALLNVPLTVIPVMVQTPPGVSVEAAARDARYTAFERELDPGECLLTAHHREDQAETLLLQALRGAGLPGLSAMPICRPLGAGWHVRPLLEVSQVELLEFGASFAGAGAGAGSGEGTGVVDPMNGDLRFDRVFLRRKLWPLLSSRWPGAAGALSRTAHHLAQAQALLERAAAADVGLLRDGDALSLRGLRALDPETRINAVRHWLRDAGIEPPSALRLTEALRQMLDAGADRQPSIVWGDHALKRYRGRLFLTEAHPPRLEGTRHLPAAPGLPLDLGPAFGKLRWVAHEGGMALRRLPEPLSVRRRVGGEVLRPEPSGRSRSVQHLCQAHGVLPWMRDALPLVFAGDALIAVADLWFDARWRAAHPEPGFAIQWDGGPIIV
jgi:tRNA(Ile)-lysidine synthase